MRKIGLVGAGAAIILSVALAGCDTNVQKATVAGPTSSGATAKGASKAPANRATVGQTLNVTGEGGVKAAVTLKSCAAHTTGTGELAEKPAHGYYVVANVQIAVTAGTYDFNPFYFKVLSSDGNAYDVSSGNAITAGFDPTLDAGTLSTGDKTGGNVVFDVPAAHGTLQLTDPLGGTIGSWTF